MPRSPIDFQVHRDKFSDVRFDAGAPIDNLTQGQVLFKINAFALTSNNICYAAAGDMLNYRSFLPGSDRWGRIPAMDFTDALASRNPEADTGLGRRRTTGKTRNVLAGLRFIQQPVDERLTSRGRRSAQTRLSGSAQSKRRPRH